MLKKILIVFLTADYKKKVFNYGINLAKKFDSKIMILNVLSKEPPLFGFFETKSDKKHKEMKKIHAEKSLKHLLEDKPNLDIPIKTKIMFSDPLSKGIISHANENEADLVILEQPKLNDLEQSYFGNTVCKLHQRLKCPLLILK